MAVKTLLLFLLSIYFVGCQTPDMELWQKVQVGMDKGEVLALLGSPRTTRRQKAQDRWTYWLYDKEILNIREVHFKDGLAVYAGAEPPVPYEQSAAYVDKRNAEAEVLAEQEEIQRKRLQAEDYAAWEASGGKEEIAARKRSQDQNPAGKASSTPANVEDGGDSEGAAEGSK